MLSMLPIKSPSISSLSLDSEAAMFTGTDLLFNSDVPASFFAFEDLVSHILVEQCQYDGRSWFEDGSISVNSSNGYG